MADVGEVLAGPWGREILGVAQTILLVFIMGSHILTFSIAFNAITGHATCTIVWSAIALVVLWICTLPRTLKRVSYFSILCKYPPVSFQKAYIYTYTTFLCSPIAFISIIASTLITMIALGIAPKSNLHLAATIPVPFATAFLSVSNIVFAYGGHVAFFTFISELRHPRDFPKALYLFQITDTCLYIIVAVVIYRYAGSSVASPALGSTGAVVKKVPYGVALPTVS